MLTGRDAVESDRDALAEFRCAPEHGESPARDVEGWIDTLLEWSAEGDSHRVRLYEDESGLVGIAAWRDLLAGEGIGFFVYLIAVRVDRRRDGIGSSILVGLFNHLAVLRPGSTAVWMVNPRNTASVALSAKFASDEPLSDPEWPHYLEFSGSLPESQQTVMPLEE